MVGLGNTEIWRVSLRKMDGRFDKNGNLEGRFGKNGNLEGRFGKNGNLEGRFGKNGWSIWEKRVRKTEIAKRLANVWTTFRHQAS